MQTGLLHTHSFLRWVILVLLLIVVYRHITAGTRAFNNTDKKTGLILMICCDIMLLIGLYQWFSGAWGLKNIQSSGIGEVMKNATQRFFAIEHTIGMLIAIILVHIARSFVKKDLPDPVKHKRSALFFGLALLIILVSIPWPFRAVGIGRGWF
jgi:uncharacterized membrane protein